MKRIAECLEGFASLAGQPGQREPSQSDPGSRGSRRTGDWPDRVQQAARLFGAAAALRERAGVPVAPARREEYERQVATARAMLDTAAFAAAWAEGRAMPPEQAIRVAREEDEIPTTGRQGS
jgi:hypothetical protein